MVLQRLLSEDRQRRFSDAASELAALKSVPMPEQSGPIARADRTVPLAPVASAAAEPSLPSLTPAAMPSRRLSRVEERDLGAEGRLWPVVTALALSALVGSALGAWLATRVPRLLGACARQRCASESLSNSRFKGITACPARVRLPAINQATTQARMRACARAPRACDS